MFVPKHCISIQTRGAWRLNRGRQGEEGSAGSQTPLQTPWAAVTFNAPLLLFSKSEHTDRDLVWSQTSSPTGSASSCNPFSPQSVSSFVETFGWVPFSFRQQMCQFGVASYCFYHGKQGITKEMIKKKKRPTFVSCTDHDIIFLQEKRDSIVRSQMHMLLIGLTLFWMLFTGVPMGEDKFAVFCCALHCSWPCALNILWGASYILTNVPGWMAILKIR